MESSALFVLVRSVTEVAVQQGRGKIKGGTQQSRTTRRRHRRHTTWGASCGLLPDARASIRARRGQYRKSTLIERYGRSEHGGPTAGTSLGCPGSQVNCRLDLLVVSSSVVGPLPDNRISSYPFDMKYAIFCRRDDRCEGNRVVPLAGSHHRCGSALTGRIARTTVPRTPESTSRRPPT
jgi:hypothetical protein